MLRFASKYIKIKWNIFIIFIFDNLNLMILENTINLINSIAHLDWK